MTFIQKWTLRFRNGVLAWIVAAACCGLPAAVWASEADLATQVQFLASDELEGRGVGLPGLDKAAEFVRDAFATAGLNVNAVGGSSFQTFTIVTSSKLGADNSLAFTLLGENAAPVEADVADFTVGSFGGSGTFQGELVFAGYGIESTDPAYNDFENIDLKGKVALVMRRHPQQGKEDGLFGTGHGVGRHGDLRSKVTNCISKGAVAVLFVNDPQTVATAEAEAIKGVALATEKLVAAVEAAAIAESLESVKESLATAALRFRDAEKAGAKGAADALMAFGYGGNPDSSTIPCFHISQRLANNLLTTGGGATLADRAAEIDKTGKPASQAISGVSVSGTTTVERVRSEVKNVIGVLEGAGPLANETVVIGAHYDHVGRGGANSLAPGSTEIHNGADDNASGTGVLLELARRFGQSGQKPARRIVFIAFTGEELGLLGSAKYVAEPVFPLAETVAMFNMDMVGRLDQDKLTVFGSGTSSRWSAELEAAAKATGLEVVPKPEGFGPSDHSSFYGKKIPVLHFFTGTHPDYHRPTDDFEKLNVSGMERVANFVERIARSTETTVERPDYLEVQGTAQIRTGNRPYVGTIPDFGSNEPGYSIGGAAPGSPADKAGLQAGDRIVRVGTTAVANLDDFDLALRKFKAGDEVEFDVIRKTETRTLKVVLGAPR